MEGTIGEGEEMLDKDAPGQVRDAAPISAAQRVEHHQMAGYGTVQTYSRQPGYTDRAGLLQQPKRARPTRS